MIDRAAVPHHDRDPRFSLVFAIARAGSDARSRRAAARARADSASRRAFDLGARMRDCADRQRVSDRRRGVDAALSIMAPFVTTSLADHFKMIDTNVRGPVTGGGSSPSRWRSEARRDRPAVVADRVLGSAWLATYGRDEGRFKPGRSPKRWRSSWGRVGHRTWWRVARVRRRRRASVRLVRGGAGPVR